MWDVFVAVFTALVPRIDADEAAQYRWRLFIAGSVMVLGVSQIVHIALACGYLTAMTGYPGFAKADSIDDVKHQLQQLAQASTSSLNEIRVEQFDSKILADRKRQCALPKENVDARELLAGRIDWELQQYRRLAGGDYRLPDCTEF